MNKIILSSGLFSRYPDLSRFNKVVSFMNKNRQWSYEIIVYPDWTDNLNLYKKQLLKDHTPIAGVHADKFIVPLLSNPKTFDEGFKKLKKNLTFAEYIHAKYVVIHLWERPNYEKELDLILKVINIAKSECLQRTKVSIETTPSKKADIMTLIKKAVLAIPDSTITLDTELFSWKNDIKIFFDNKALSKKLINIHIRDFDGKPFDSIGNRKYLSIGEGRLDFAWLFRELRKIKFQGNFTIENFSANKRGYVQVRKIEKEIQKVKQLINISK